MVRLSVPVFILTVAATAALGFALAHFPDKFALEKLAADRDRARDCRHSDSTLPPCPVEYRNTKIVWREKTVATPVPDPHQARRIAALSAELADARRSVRELEQRQAAGEAARPAVYNYLQNGSMARPYATSDRCPSGATVVYVAANYQRNMTGRRLGDPNVCYVRIAQR